MERSEIRECSISVRLSRIARSLSSGARSRDLSAPSGLRSRRELPARTNSLSLLRPIDPTGKSPKTCPAPSRKIFRFAIGANHLPVRRCPVPLRGALRNVTNAERDAVDADGAEDEQRRMRTAKSCGPDAPTLASSLREVTFADDGGKKAGRRGEHEGSRKTTAQGKPDDPATPVVLPPCFFCTGPTGATGTRLSLRPLIKEGGTNR